MFLGSLLDTEPQFRRDQKTVKWWNCYTCQQKILKYFVNVITSSVLESGGREFHNELINQRSRNILDKKVVCVAAGKFDIKNQG